MSCRCPNLVRSGGGFGLIFLILSLVAIFVQSSSLNNSNEKDGKSSLSSISSDNLNEVEQAIEICREKLEVDPYFPKVQHSLALLLDSRLPLNDGEYEHNDEVSQVIDLYQAVGLPPKQVPTKRVPPSSIRFKALCRAASLSLDYLDDTVRAISLYNESLELDGFEDEDALIAVFEIVMPLMLATVTVESSQKTKIDSGSAFPISLSARDDSRHNYLQRALTLCDRLTDAYPHEPIVHEYRGATLRKLQQPELAFHSYLEAMEQSKRLYIESSSLFSGGVIQANAENVNTNKRFMLLTSYIQRSVLLSAAGRESGLINPDEQLNLLRDAEGHCRPLLKAIAGTMVESSTGSANTSSGDDMNPHHRQLLLEQGLEAIVDLYNNMGIIEKKRNAFSEARIHFLKALDVKPNDGHALVQLASIEGTDMSSDIITDVSQLDPDYVSSLFDGYSSRFESELVDVLKYRGHFQVYEAFLTAWKTKLRSNLTPSSITTVVDLGCGTGLLGELFANDMPWLDIRGVDLSKRMVNIAKGRQTVKQEKVSNTNHNTGAKIYSAVANEDAAKYLGTLKAHSVDTIVASDVFIYIGDISKVLEASARCLCEDGLVCFTVESYDTKGHEKDNGLRLLASGRFGHSKDYINRIASSSGFEIVTWESCILRQQGGDDVQGAVVVLKKSQ